MKHILIGAGLFIFQIYFTFFGETFLGKTLFDKYLNPVFLFIVSMTIPGYLIWLCLKPTSQFLSTSITIPWYRALWALGGLLTVVATYEEFRKALVRFSEPEKWSDVITQVRVLYERFSHGEFPYTPIELVNYNLLPVYMPLHWMPCGLADPLNIDLRWIGFGFFAIAVAVYSWFLAYQPGSIVSRCIALLLPSLPIWAFIKWGEVDLMVNYEIVIGAYYLILITGLVTRRLWLITLGIILCLLSRYTLLFWLPLFALLLLIQEGWKKSLLVWGTVATFFILFYVIPFYTKDPKMLSRGISHYIMATIGEWRGYGDPPISWTHERGISFAPHMKAVFLGEMADRVYSARIVQSVIMLILFVSGWLAWRRWCYRIDLYTFNLVTLYCFITCYYFFAPLTYRYYFFPLLVVSAVLCGKIVMYGTQKKYSVIGDRNLKKV